MENDEVVERLRDGLLERLCEAVEKLSEPPPEAEEDLGPPVCPHCGVFDPVVEIPDGQAGSGPLSQVHLEFKCRSCGNQGYAVLLGYSMHADKNSLKEEALAKEANMALRRAGGNV